MNWKFEDNYHTKKNEMEEIWDNIVYFQELKSEYFLDLINKCF